MAAAAENLFAKADRDDGASDEPLVPRSTTDDSEADSASSRAAEISWAVLLISSSSNVAVGYNLVRSDALDDVYVVLTCVGLNADCHRLGAKNHPDGPSAPTRATHPRDALYGTNVNVANLPAMIISLRRYWRQLWLDRLQAC